MAKIKTVMTSDEALQVLKDGNERFVSSTPTHPHQDMVWVVSQAGGQVPFVTVLSCADSRVVPEMIFDQGIGDIFSLRVAGNVAEDDTVLASMEYAVAELGVPLIVVLGHQSCGAVQAALAGGDLPGHLNRLIEALSPAIEQARQQSGDVVDNAIVANVHLQVEKLKMTAPIFAENVKAGKLKVIGAKYSLENGSVTWFE